MIDYNATCNQEDQLNMVNADLARNQKRTLSVVILTFFVMIIEIAFGYWTGSMALLADGYHMASHVGALGLSYIVYRLAQSKKLQARLNFGTGKLLPLGGYTSAVILGLMALWMVVESLLRFMNPEQIHFKEALWVAVLGLVTNLVSAWLLGWNNHSHDHGGGHSHDHHDDHKGCNHAHDHNHESALAHVLADALTSVMAVAALLVGSLYGLHWLDPAMGLVGAFVIIKWSYTLCRKSAWELLDGSVTELNSASIVSKIQQQGVTIHDFHLWKTGPRNFVCIVSLSGPSESIRDKIRSFFPTGIKLHLIVEDRD